MGEVGETTLASVFKIWGCRGSAPTPGAAHLRYGGETTCYEIRRGEERLWIDAGTGLRSAAAHWAAGGAADVPSLLLSHLHLDHVMGLGALAPHLSPERPATLYVAGDVEAVRSALGRLYAPPFWPVALFESGKFRLESLQMLEPKRLGGFAVRPFPLNHPGGCSGFEIEVDGARVVIAADHEHGDRQIDAALEARMQGADLVVYDAAYGDAEYPARRGWGHSTREEGLRLADRARPRRMLLTHHDPTADDARLSAFEESQLAERSSTVALARDGMTILLDAPKGGPQFAGG